MLINIWGHLSYFLRDFSEYLLILAGSTLTCLILLYALHKSQCSKMVLRISLVFIFTFLSTVYIFSGFEAYLRYKFDESDSLGFLRITARWYQRHVVTNNYQYRDKNFSVEKTPGKVRIGVMGDSNGFGYGIKDAHNRFSDLLEKKLLENGYNAEVYNFSVPGFDTEQELNEYKRVDKFNFDILVWEYFLNDAEQASQSAGTKVLQNAQQIPRGIISFLSDHSYFFDYIYWRLDARYDKTFAGIRNADIKQYSIQDIFNYHREIINRFLSDIQSQGKKVVVLIYPFFYSLPNYPQEAVDIHKKMNLVFAEQHVAQIVDMLEYVKGKQRKDLIVGPYDSHANETVHALTAEKLYDAIIPLLEKDEGGETHVKE